MRKHIIADTMVSTEAWRFDNMNMDRNNRWSFAMYGEQHMDARVMGRAIRKEGVKWILCWEDGETSAIMEDFLVQLQENEVDRPVKRG